MRYIHYADAVRERCTLYDENKIMHRRTGFYVDNLSHFSDSTVGSAGPSFFLPPLLFYFRIIFILTVDQLISYRVMSVSVYNSLWMGDDRDTAQ